MAAEGPGNAVFYCPDAADAQRELGPICIKWRELEAFEVGSEPLINAAGSDAVIAVPGVGCPARGRMNPACVVGVRAIFVQARIDGNDGRVAVIRPAAGIARGELIVAAEVIVDAGNAIAIIARC